MNKRYSYQEKLEYYKKRANNKHLSANQREYAEGFCRGSMLNAPGSDIQKAKQYKGLSHKDMLEEVIGLNSRLNDNNDPYYAGFSYGAIGNLRKQMYKRKEKR